MYKLHNTEIGRFTYEIRPPVVGRRENIATVLQMLGHNTILTSSYAARGIIHFHHHIACTTPQVSRFPKIVTMPSRGEEINSVRAHSVHYADTSAV